MDQFTKLVSGQLKAQPVSGPHPAPELLSAFAENALPEADRGPLLHHLGSCSDCREILFLALPDSPEVQKVLTLKPNRFRRWGLTWGAAFAAVAIAAVILTTSHLERNDQTVQVVATAPPAAETKIAAESTSPELDQMQAVRDSTANKKTAAVAENEIKPQPAPKHMTGKMQSPLVFDRSGEVHVQTPAQSENAATVGIIKSDKDGDMEEKLKQGPGVEFSSVVAQPASAGSADAASATGQQAGDQAYVVTPNSAALRAEARNAPSPPSPTPVSSTTSSLGGVIVDPSGAMVGNAKVTTIGPAGAKTATSDSKGRFSFDLLTPGFYSIRAEASGFKPAEIRQIAVLDNKPSDIRVTLDVGARADVVEVTGAAAELDTSTGFVAGRQTVDLSAQKARQSGTGASAGAKVTNLQWTLSPKGAVQRSSDSGKTWQAVSVANAAGFRALSAVGANIWVGGKAGALYHSLDFGQTWSRVEPAAESKKLDKDIVRLDFPDSLSGTVNTANGEVWTTSDAGTTWQRK